MTGMALVVTIYYRLRTGSLGAITNVGVVLDMIDMYIGTYLARVERMWGDVSFFQSPQGYHLSAEKALGT